MATVDPTACYWLLEDGTGKWLLEDGSGFFMLEVCDIVAGGLPTYHPTYETQQYRKRFDDQIEARKTAIIDLKLESQEILIRKREIEALNDKQSLRQLKAAAQQLEKINNEIRLEIEALNKAIAQDIKNKQALNQLILSMALPWMRIH